MQTKKAHNNRKSRNAPNSGIRVNRYYREWLAFLHSRQVSGAGACIRYAQVSRRIPKQEYSTKRNEFFAARVLKSIVYN